MVGFQSISVATLQTATPEAVVTWMFVVSRAAKIANSSLRSGPLLFVHDKPGLVRESLLGFLAGAFENKVGGASALTRGGNLDQLLLPRRRAQTESRRSVLWFGREAHVCLLYHCTHNVRQPVAGQAARLRFRLRLSNYLELCSGRWQRGKCGRNPNGCGKRSQALLNKAS